MSCRCDGELVMREEIPHFGRLQDLENQINLLRVCVLLDGGFGILVQLYILLDSLWEVGILNLLRDEDGY
jgi:hypothetical protein